MKPPFDPSPLGTARAALTGAAAAPDDQHALLQWLGPVRERLRSRLNLEEEVAFLAWELARWPEGLALEDRQALVLLILTALVQQRQGSTRLPLRGTSGRAVRLERARQLLPDAAPGAASLDPAWAVERALALIDAGRLEAILGEPGSFKPLIDAGPHLYLQKMLSLEDRFVESLRRRLDLPGPPWSAEETEAALRDVLARPALRDGREIRPTTEQQAAVRAAATYSATVVSGGPGTGKTTIVVSILRTLGRLGVRCEEIALAAPTGKAANRIGQAIGTGLEGIAAPAPEDRDLLANLPDPRTLHRLLGYSQRTGRFLHHENNRLAERVVIVDEGSMIDLALMERLLRSLRDEALFVLLGDARQIPSVEAGAVLRDLLADGGEGSPLGRRGVRLTESHRMRRDDDDGRNLFTVAGEIDRGAVPAFVPARSRDDEIVERATAADVRFRGVEFLEAPEGPDALDAFLERWDREIVRSLDGFAALASHEYHMTEGTFDPEDEARLRRLFDHFDRARILCLTRVLPTGADRINATLRRRILEGRSSGPDGDFAPGEPVMMQVNDNTRMIFNGDQGLVLNVAERGRAEPMVVFPRTDGFGVFHLDSLRPVLLHSYAMTIHKAQGSEFDRVALVLPDRDLPINTREILYTALTRARTGALLIGNRGILELGIAKAIHRDSGIAEKLGSEPPGKSGSRSN